MCDTCFSVQPPIGVQNFLFPNPLIIQLPALVRFEPGERKLGGVLRCWMTRVGVGGSYERVLRRLVRLLVAIQEAVRAAQHQTDQHAHDAQPAEEAEDSASAKISPFELAILVVELLVTHVQAPVRAACADQTKADAHAAPHSDPVGPGEKEATLL